MQRKTLDEFDQFCRIAKNPISETAKYCNYDQFRASNLDSNLYRSNSMRERPVKKLKEMKTEELSTNMNLAEENKIVRVRSFRRTTKGIVCNKDTIEIEQDQETEKDNLMNSIRKNNETCNYRIQKNIDNEQNSTSINIEKIRYNVTLLGQEGVGKTSLCQQLLIPEFLVSQSDEMKSTNEAQMIRVLVDNQESILQLIDNENCDILNEHKQFTTDAYLIIYAVDDNSSFEACRKLIANLVLTNVNPPLVILVGNKSDLVRSRVVSTDKGKRLASIYNVKFKEISTSLNHCVDELLVLLVTEMRNQSKRIEKHKIGFLPKGFQSTPYRSSLRIKVSNNAVSRFIQKHFNKSSDNVSINDQ